MSDVVPTLGRREERERGRGERGDMVEGTWSCGPQERFEFGEGHLDGIEIWTVGRQKADLRAHGFDRGAHLGLLVDGEIVEHDDVARSERRDQHLLDVGEEAGVVDRPIEDGRRRDAVRPQGGDDRVRLPMAARRVIAQPHAAEAAPVSAQQIGRGTTLIEKDVLPGIMQRQPVAPAPPLSGDGGAALFVGVYRFF